MTDAKGFCVSISIVNGYLCTSACDAAKARTGQDPHPRSATNQTPNVRPDPSEPPAVTFGGSLSGLNAVAPVGPAALASGANGNPPSSSLDIRA